MKSTQHLNSLALKTRKLWGEDTYSPIDIFSIVNGLKDTKITLVKHPLSPRISGMYTKENEDVIICVNSNTSYGRQRFTLAHELYHVLYEEEIKQVICNMSMQEIKSDSEREADWFASYLLMPYDALIQYSETCKNWTLEKVIEAEQFFQISHQAMLFRLLQEEILSQKEVDSFKTISISKLSTKLGYDNELYLPSKKSRTYFTTGEYIRKVEKLEKMQLISNGKKEELLLDAYRADIVYDLDEEELYLND